jgi:hypothetical protein
MAVIRYFSSSTPGPFSGINAGCRCGWHCAALAAQRQTPVQRCATILTVGLMFGLLFLWLLG